MMDELFEKCNEFLTWLHGDFRREFESKYCFGSSYETFTEKDPNGFVKSALLFSLTHQDSNSFQYSATRHIGNVEKRRNLLEVIEKKTRDPSVQTKSSSCLNCDELRITNRNAQQELSGQNRTERKISGDLGRKNSSEIRKTDTLPVEPQKNHKKTHGQLFPPRKIHSDEELRESIKCKLFAPPLTHDRYTSLTVEERRFIRRYAGLSAREREVFDHKCGMAYNPYRFISQMMSCSESRVKQLASRIDRKIWRIINN